MAISERVFVVVVERVACLGFELDQDRNGQKVSDVVKEGEREKLRAAETEGRNWQASIEQFERLKIE